MTDYADKIITALENGPSFEPVMDILDRAPKAERPEVIATMVTIMVAAWRVAHMTSVQRNVLRGLDRNREWEQ